MHDNVPIPSRLNDVVDNKTLLFGFEQKLNE